MTRTSWVGVVMIVTSLASLGAWTMWSKTRTWCLIDEVPISLSAGSRYSSGELAVNLNAQYSIEIHAENSIDSGKLKCLLGAASKRDHCDTNSRLKVEWVLSSEGKTIEGSSDDDAGGLGEIQSEPVRSSRFIGFFRGQTGHRYKLEVHVLSDSSGLNVTNPTLYVGVFDPSLEFNLVVSGLLKVVSIVTAVIGAFLLIRSLLAQRHLDLA